MTQLDDLKRLAEAATKGPWTIKCRNAKFYNEDGSHKSLKECMDLYEPKCANDDYHLGADIKELPEAGRAAFVLKDAFYIASVSPDKILALISSHEQLQKRFEEAVEVIKIIDLNFKKITKCPDNSCDGCHEDAKIAAEYSSKFLASWGEER